MGITQSQLNNDPTLLSPRKRITGVPSFNLSPRGAQSASSSLVNAIKSKTPRSFTNSHENSIETSCDFIDLPDINIEDIELYENIGWGATGVIKRGKWKDKYVAVKQLFPHASSKEFKKELIHWSEIKHPNIVELLGACTKPGSLCIVMEYIKEGDLCSFLHSVDSRNPTVWPLLYRVAVDVARAMLHIHTTSDRIHRDLKSRNILLNSLNPDGIEPVAKVCDFGDCRSVGFTMTPKVGTMSYMAPEIIKCENYSNKVDVYSYAMLLWEIITRKEPYEDEAFMYEIAEKVTNGLRPDLPSYCPNSVAELIQDCWATNPDDRPNFRTILRRLGTIGELWKKLDVNDIIEKNNNTSKDSNNTSESDDIELNIPLKRVSSSLLSASKVPKIKLEAKTKVYSLQRQVSYTGEESDDSYDESSDSDIDEIDDISDIDDLLQSPELSDSEKVKQLRELSHGQNDLQKLLSKDKSTINTDTLINVLKTTLSKECLQSRELRKHNEFLRSRIKIEKHNRLKLEEKIKTTKKQITETVFETSLDLKELITSSAKEETLYDIKLQQQKKIKWCEIEFNEIQPENSPYRYSTFGIWYKAQWDFNNAHLCIAIGGIHNEYIHNFRQVSSRIQQLSNHPNMCTLVGILSNTPNFGLLYSVKETSCELHDYITTNKISVSDKLYIILQIAKVIEYCHKNQTLMAWMNHHTILVDSNTLHVNVIHVCHLQSFVRQESSWDSHKWNAPECWLKNQTSKEREPFPSFTQNKANKLAAGWRPSIPFSVPEDISTLILDCWRMKSSDRISASDCVNRIKDLMKIDYSDYYINEPKKEKKKRYKLFSSSAAIEEQVAII